MRPEGADPIPIFQQCALDTTWCGWTPTIYLNTIRDWLSKYKHLFEPEEYKALRLKAFKAYKVLQSALYTRADALQQTNRHV